MTRLRIFNIISIILCESIALNSGKCICETIYNLVPSHEGFITSSPNMEICYSTIQNNHKFFHMLLLLRSVMHIVTGVVQYLEMSQYDNLSSRRYV